MTYPELGPTSRKIAQLLQLLLTGFVSLPFLDKLTPIKSRMPHQSHTAPAGYGPVQQTQGLTDDDPRHSVSVPAIILSKLFYSFGLPVGPPTAVA